MDTGKREREGSGGRTVFRGLTAGFRGTRRWIKPTVLALGMAAFLAVYLAPTCDPIVDPFGRTVTLTREGQATLGLFILALLWWASEAIPIGVTAIAVGVLQALFRIRPPRKAFSDFMHPYVWIIFGSLVIGMVFAKTGLARRISYRALAVMGERTRVLYAGIPCLILVLTLLMAHTAVAAIVFPLLMAINALYERGGKTTRFGKGLFIGMAFAAGAGSVVTLLGSVRAPAAIGLFEEITGRPVSFFALPVYLFPFAAAVLFVSWLLLLVLFPPETAVVEGLRERALLLHQRLGPISRKEVLSLVVVFVAIAVLTAHSYVSFLRPVDKSAIVLLPTVLFFVFGILSVKDLEEVPWNIMLLFGGAMSLGFCLWETHAAQWIAAEVFAAWPHLAGLFFLLATGVLVLLASNVLINAAVIAFCLPLGLAAAPYAGVSADLVLFACLVAAGMPVMLVIGSAPNAIAYESHQFTAREFFRAGALASGLILGMLYLFARWIWPFLGMPRA